MSKIEKGIKGLQLKVFFAEEADDVKDAYDDWRDQAVAAGLERKILSVEAMAKLDEYAMFVFYTE